VILDKQAENKLIEDLGYIRGKIDGICQEQEDNKKSHGVIFDRLDKQGKELAELKVRSSVFGAVFGAIGGFVANWFK